jgi:hypothetical protein
MEKFGHAPRSRSDLYNAGADQMDVGGLNEITGWVSTSK